MYQGLTYEMASVMPLATDTGLFTALASFTMPVQTQGATGNLTGTQTPINGLQNIPCMNTPESIRIVANDEKKSIAHILSGRYRHVLLSACYPILSAAAGLGWQCSIDGVLYDLLGAEDDSQQTQTRVRLQLVTL